MRFMGKQVGYHRKTQGIWKEEQHQKEQDDESY
jgi:hypothetical protein